MSQECKDSFTHLRNLHAILGKYLGLYRVFLIWLQTSEGVAGLSLIRSRLGTQDSVGLLIVGTVIGKSLRQSG